MWAPHPCRACGRRQQYPNTTQHDASTFMRTKWAASALRRRQVFSKVRELDRLDEVCGASLGGGGSQDRVVEARYCDDDHLRVMLPRQMNQLKPVVLAETHIDDEDVRSVFRQKSASVFE